MPEASTQPERVKMGQLFDLLIEHYKLSKRKSVYDCQNRVKGCLRPFFGSMKASEIGTAVLKRFMQRRLRQKIAPATINRELALVRRAMNLGVKHEPPLVLRKPHFQMLQADNAREGTLDHEHYRAVRDRLPLYVRIAFVIAHHTGARRDEITSVLTDKVDMRRARIHFPGRITKNGAPKYVPIDGDMKPELDMWLTRIAGSECPYLIRNNGERVSSFYKAWKTACKAAGVPATLFHDMRRTAASNMIEAGWTEKEAMEVTGHKTRSMFDRYHIVSERRMKQNASKLEELLEQKDQEAREAQKDAVMVRDAVRDAKTGVN